MFLLPKGNHGGFHPGIWPMCSGGVGRGTTCGIPELLGECEEVVNDLLGCPFNHLDTPSSPGALPIFILASARVSSCVVGVSLSHCAGMGLVGTLSQTRWATGTAPFCILLK